VRQDSRVLVFLHKVSAITALRFSSPSPRGKSESKAAGGGRSPSSFLYNTCGRLGRLSVSESEKCPDPCHGNGGTYRCVAARHELRFLLRSPSHPAPSPPAPVRSKGRDRKRKFDVRMRVGHFFLLQYYHQPTSRGAAHTGARRAGAVNNWERTVAQWSLHVRGSQIKLSHDGAVNRTLVQKSIP
jgi:hypothetical protein